MRHLLSLPLSFFLLLALPSCDRLDPIAQGECGNGVVDEKEACDGSSNKKFDCIAKGLPSECRWTCKDRPCPEKNGCGTDDVCRVATGGFRTTPFAEVASEARVLLSGHFDTDGKADVVTVEPGQLKILFFNDTGDVQQAAFSSSTRPSIGKLGPLEDSGLEDADKTTTDHTDDMVLPLSIGIGGLLSRGDRSFAARTYGTVSFGTIPLPGNKLADIVDAQPFALDALPGFLENRTGDETIVLVTYRVQGAQSDSAEGLVFSLDTNDEIHLLTLPNGTVADLSGPPIKGNFDKDPCEEIAFPRKDATALVVDKLCDYNFDLGVYHWNDGKTEAEAAMATVQLSAGGTIAGPVFVFDVNGDALQDLLITTSCGPDCYEMQVAYSLGTGTFSSAAPGAVGGDPPQENVASVYGNHMDRVPFALGDVNRDGLPDIVNATQFLAGSTSPGGEVKFQATYDSKRTWTEAVIGDINGNLYPDVVACTRNAQDVDVLSGNPSSFLNPSLIATEGDVAQLTIGDFDGDLVNDLAFQIYTDQKQDDSQLVVSYGRTSGGLEAPVEIGRFRSIARTVTGNEHAFGVDNITDLGIVSRLGDNDPPTFSVFPGTGTRFMQAPLLLSNPMGLGVEVPLQTALGVFPPDPAAPSGSRLHNDLVVLAQRPVFPEPGEDILDTLGRVAKSLTIWRLIGAGEGDFTAPRSITCAAPQGAFSLPGLEQASSVVVSEAGAGEPGVVFVSAPHLKTFKEMPFLEITTVFSRPALEGACDGGQKYVGEPGEQFLRMATADLDGNGEPEVLALKQTFDNGDLIARLSGAESMGDPFAGAQSSEVVVFWNGVLGEDEGHSLVYEVLPGQPGSVDDFAIADLDLDGRPEVFVAGIAGIHVYAYDKIAGGLVATPLPGFGAPGISAVHVADVDGDGVKDLITGGNALRFYHGFTTTDADVDISTGSDPVAPFDR